MCRIGAIIPSTCMLLCLLSSSHAFSPTVTIDCLQTTGHIQVDLTGASTTGTVVLYNNVPAYCTNFPTPTSVISVTFTTCDNPADFPALETTSSIYVTNNTDLRPGDPDKRFEVTCYSNGTETVVEKITTVEGVTGFISPSVGITVTDMGDNPVSSIIVGTDYKMKIACPTAIEQLFDTICSSIIINNEVPLLTDGCSVNEDMFPTFTRPAQCQLETTFCGFHLTRTSEPTTLSFHFTFLMCDGLCATPPNCGPPANGRKKRGMSVTHRKATIETIELYKDIMVYPADYNFTKSKSSDSRKTTIPSVKTTTTVKTTPTTTEMADQECMSTTIVYPIVATICALICTGVLTDVSLMFYLKQMPHNRGKRAMSNGLPKHI